MATNPVLAQILKEARKRNAPYKHVKAAVETGIVESNLTNVSHGDADSLGWRQERASLYKNPLNLKASVKRFFDEAEQHDRAGLSAGELAANVQRPAAQYRGRYNQVAGRAAELIRKGGGAETHGTGDNAPVSPGLRQTTQFDRADYEAARRKSLVANLLARSGDTSNNPLFTSGLLSLDAPNPEDYTRRLTETVAGTERQPQRITGNNGGGRHPSSQLLELFLGQTSFKNGQPAAPVAGHDDHLHFASKPKQVDAISRLAQRMGLTVRENPGFDPVERVHVEGSYHYSDQAADISGDPRQLRRLSRKIQRRYGVR